ncbi:MAG: glycerol-3-phosphate dehydrogenase/oxidase [Carbonactinosporaceae bacterium]
MTGSLNAAQRARDLESLASGRVVDVLVVGGGVTGTGVALDAASRGLSVALVERRDLAHGTSRWSSKLVHGGLRYLARGELGLAYESARERGLLMERIAPHLVRPLPMLLPLELGVPGRQAALVGAGFRTGDLLRLLARTRRDTLPRPRRLSRVETRCILPGVRGAGLRGGLLAWEGQLVDDARLVVALARTAARYGARVVTRCAALTLAEGGARVRDELTGIAYDVHARAVINATGVWAGGLAAGVRLRPSRGTHLVVSAGRLGGLGAGLTMPVPGEPDRFVFALPQPDGLAYVGLTDEPVGGEPEDPPRAQRYEVDFLLRVVSTALETPLGPSDVLGTFSGVRPLLDGPAGSRSADLSRRHAVIADADGVVTVVGGKLTTYRRMAQDALDAALARSGLRAGPCVTSRLPLVGAAPSTLLDGVPSPRRLVGRYGTEAPAVLAAAGGDPDLLLPLAEGLEVTGAELVWGLRHEGALGVDDLLDRRTRVGLVPADRARALPVAERLAAGAHPARA